MVPTISAPVVIVFAANTDGNSGDNILNGTPEADTITGFEGNDQIFGEGGEDILNGGPGSDEIRGGDGNDEIKDENDDGNLEADPPDYDNKVYGGSGNDNIELGVDYTRTDYYYVYGEDGADYIKVVSNAHVEGGIDDDTIYCTGYECIINGNEGNDEIHVQLYDISGVTNGGSGDDNLFGKGYNVNGDGGNDYLSMYWALDLKGGEGNDVLEATSSVGGSYFNGGSGADTFNCSPGPDDIVEDYNPTEGDTVSSHCETVEGSTLP
ncbi:MAG: hypothetical protein M3115_03220 [Thermoproteota archaeon]|nr:hypothetical protein [Thermoproteota archaeon]